MDNSDSCGVIKRFFGLPITKYANKQNRRKPLTQIDKQSKNQISSVPVLNSLFYKKFHSLSKTEFGTWYATGLLKNQITHNPDTVEDYCRKQHGLFIQSHTQPVSCVAITNNGLLVSGSYDATIRIWDLKKRRQVCLLKEHSCAVIHLAITTNFIVSSSYYEIIMWNIQDTSDRRTIKFTPSVTSMTITNDEAYIFVGLNDCTLRIFNVKKDCEEKSINGKMTAIASSSKYIVCASAARHLLILNISEQRIEGRLHGHRHAINSLAISRECKYIASGSSDRTVRLWDLKQQKEEAVLEGHTYGVSCVAITNDTVHIVSASLDKTIRVWSIEKKTLIFVHSGFKSIILSCAVTDDSSLIVSSMWDNTIAVSGFVDKTERKRVEGHTSGITCAVTSLDRRYTVSGSYDCNVQVWNVLEKKQEALFIGHTASVTCVAITYDSQFIVSGSNDMTVRIWSLAGKEEVGVLRDHTASVASVVITRDSKYLISASHDKHIIAWTLADRKKKVEYYGTEVKSMVVSISSKYLVSVNCRNIARVWKL